MRLDKINPMLEKQELQRTENELKAQRERILERIKKAQEKSQSADMVNPGRDDLAYRYMSAEMQKAEQARLEERRAQIEIALERIRKGQYGQCEHCGKPISAARLRALPYASTCIQCQEKMS